MSTLFEMREYAVGQLRDVLTRLLPEKVLEESPGGKGAISQNPRAAALKIVDKVVAERVSGEAFADVLAWAVGFLEDVSRSTGKPLRMFSVATLTAGMSGSLFDYLGVGDQAEAEANYGLDSGEEEKEWQ